MADRKREPLEISDTISDTISEDGLLYHSTPSPPSFPSRISRLIKPLIDYFRIEWQSGAKYTHLPSSSAAGGGVTDRSESCPQWMQMHMILSIVAAPRFRRYVLVYLSLLVTGWIGWQFFLSPRLEEQASLLQALDPTQADKGWFGTNALPELENVVLLRDLDDELRPSSSVSRDGDGEGGSAQKRLIIVGDVHGCKTELERLLDETSFNNETDHLIFTGDMINKGPDSRGVVDLAREYSASCVRGNHEDRVLLLRHELTSNNTNANSTTHRSSVAQDANTHQRELARQLSPDQVSWLDACPVILDVGQIPGMGQVVVVHAGLVPGVDLHKQDPYSVMNMHTIDLATHVPSSSRSKGVKWTKLFNRHQDLVKESESAADGDGESGVVTVIYGHDAKTGLNIKTYTKGLDSGCVKGGKLTALVVSESGKQKVVQVKCSKHLKDD